MKAIRLVVIAAVLVASSSSFAALTKGAENCQAQAGSSFNAKQKHQQAAEALRVVEGAAKPPSKTQQPSSKAISEKGS